MKKTMILLVTVLTMAACGGSQQGSIDKGKENAVKYAREAVFDNMTGVKSISVTKTDSVLTDDMIDEQAVEEKANALITGHLSEDDFKSTLDSINTIICDIWSTWQGGYRKTQVEGKYPGQWRFIYTVTAVMESGAEHYIRVLMKHDGNTPDMTEYEYRNKQKNKHGVLQALTRELRW